MSYILKRLRFTCYVLALQLPNWGLEALLLKLMTRTRKIDRQRLIFHGRILSADKNRSISWRAQLFWRTFCRRPKHGQFRRQSSCNFLRTSCMNERHLNFNIISRHTLWHSRPKRHFVRVFEWNRKTNFPPFNSYMQAYNFQVQQQSPALTAAF